VSKTEKPSHIGQIAGASLVGVGSFVTGVLSTRINNRNIRITENFSGTMPDIANLAKDTLRSTLKDTVDFSLPEGKKIITSIENTVSESKKEVKDLVHLNISVLGDLNTNQKIVLAAGAITLAAGTAYLLRPKNDVTDPQYDGVVERQHIETVKK
jgi:hypothetical protein